MGDNVGDCAGMAADLFETYAVTVVATMVLAAIFFSGPTGSGRAALEPMMLYPLAIGAACIVTSIVGTYAVRLSANQSIMGALYKGLIAAGALSIVAIGAVTYTLLGGFSTVFTTSTGQSFTAVACSAAR